MHNPLTRQQITSIIISKDKSRLSECLSHIRESALLNANTTHQCIQFVWLHTMMTTISGIHFPVPKGEPTYPNDNTRWDIIDTWARRYDNRLKMEIA